MIDDYELKQNIQEKIKNVTNEIIADYNQNRAIDNKDDMFHQPNREIIFECIRNLLRIIYPGFYQTSNYKVYNLQDLISVLTEDVMFHLSKQIYIAMRYRHDINSEEKEELMIKAQEITLRFLGKIPEIRSYLEEDLQAAFDGDPAAFNLDEIIISYPGLFAISIYRLAHELYLLDIPLIPRVMTEYAHSRTGIDIHPGATIGHHFFIDHGTGIVVGQSTVIGNNVKLYQGVTLGALSTHGGQALRNVRRHPTIEDDVTIYSNASVLGGDTVIGQGSVIGGNAFVTKSIKPCTRVNVKIQELQLTDVRSKSKTTDPKDECWYYVI